MTDKAKPTAEVEARAINATDWQPLRGMVKKQCSQCRRAATPGRQGIIPTRLAFSGSPRQPSVP